MLTLDPYPEPFNSPEPFTDRFQDLPPWTSHFYGESPSHIQDATRFFILTGEDMRNFPSLAGMFGIYIYESPQGKLETGILKTPEAYRNMAHGEPL